MPGLKQLQLKNTANVAETERVRFKQQLGILTAAVDQTFDIPSTHTHTTQIYRQSAVP